MMQVCLQPHSHAQNAQYYFNHLTVEDGLLSNEVNALCQDSRGYMWIGTNNGLQRYDGKRFVNYLADLSKPDALHQSWIKAIFEDSRHRLWVGSGAPYQFRNNSFYNYNLHRLQGTPIVDGVRNFIEDGRGDIWAVSKDSYYKLNPSTDQFEDYGKMVGISESVHPGFLRTDKNGNVWFVTSRGISFYDPALKKYYDRNNNPLHLKLLDVDQAVFSFCIEAENIWMGYNLSRSLYQYNISSNSITEHPVKNIENEESFSKNIDSKIESILFSTEKRLLFVLPGEGLVVYDPSTKTMDEVPVSNGEINGLHSNLETFVGILTYEDHDKNLWVGGDRGLNIFSLQKKQFTFYGSRRSVPGKGLPAFNVNGMIRDRITGDIFVAYYFNEAGIIRLSKDLSFKKQYLYRRDGTTNLSENQIWCLFQDEEGVIWAPNQAKTILKLDPRTDQLSLLNDPALLDNINVIQSDARGNTWMGTWKNGLRMISGKDHAVINFPATFPGSAFSPRNIFSLCFDGDSILWVGTNESGLLKFDLRTKQYIHQYLFDEKNPAAISSNVISRIIRWNRDTLLMATNTGLNFFNKNTGAISNLSAKDGLPGDVVTNLEIDQNNNLWVGCFGGLCKVNLNPLRITRYGVKDGIANTAIDKSPFLKMEDGRYLVPTLKGFFAFHADDGGIQQIQHPPVITGLNVFEKNLAVDSFIRNQATVRLSYKENSLTIEFASLQFNIPDKPRFYYKLEGMDKDWVQSSDEQAAQYHRLEYGHYTFKVKSVNRDGVESETNFPLLIEISPPFWKTWWFRTLIILLMGSVVYALLRWQKKRRKEKEQLRVEYEKRIATVEMNMLRAQMNPHFIFNSLNSINTFILENDPDNAVVYLQKFSSLVRLILDNSRSEWILLENELKALRLYIELESLRFDHVFAHELKIQPEIQPGSVWVPPLIIQPYVENAIRHGLIHRTDGKGLLEVNVSKENEQLLIEIRDNGIGREASEKMKNRISGLQQPSHGMLITAERLEIVNLVYNANAGVRVTDIKDSSGVCSGTSVLINIQYKTYAGNNH